MKFIHHLQQLTILIGDLELDLEKSMVRYAGKPIRLGRLEHRIIAALIINAGKPVTYRMLAEELWGGDLEYDEVAFRKIFSDIVRRISKKLAEAGALDLIHVIERVGYCIPE